MLAICYKIGMLRVLAACAIAGFAIKAVAGCSDHEKPRRAPAPEGDRPVRQGWGY
jgi:hypothetical protein